MQYEAYKRNVVKDSLISLVPICELNLITSLESHHLQKRDRNVLRCHDLPEFFFNFLFSFPNEKNAYLNLCETTV